MVRQRMHKMTVKDFGLRCVSTFAVPRPYDEAMLNVFVVAALREFATYGVTAQNFSKNEGDRLFGYGLSFSLFNGNATFVLNGDSLGITLLNGQGQRDIELIKDLLNRAHKCLPEPEQLTHAMMGFCHAEFVGENSVEKVFAGLVVTNGPARPVGASVLSEEPTEALLPLNERIKLDIAPSELKENRIFMSWKFTARGVLSEEYWTTLGPRLKAIAGSLSLELV